MENRFSNKAKNFLSNKFGTYSIHTYQSSEFCDLNLWSTSVERIKQAVRLWEIFIPAILKQWFIYG